MSTHIYYFSGTGNSLHVAQELQRRLPESTLVPIIRALHNGNIATRAESVGVVFPIHAFTLPYPVKQFLAQTDFSSARYIFAVATRLCLDRVFSGIDTILARQGKSLDAAFAVEMPCNYIPVFTIPPQEEIAEMERRLERRLDEIQALVSSRIASREKDELLLALAGAVIYPAVIAWYQKVRFPWIAKSFYADEKCNGCGTCARVCLSGKVRLADGGPVWQKDVDCTYCFACLHYCPAEAIQIKGTKTLTRARYHHSDIKSAAIAAQKPKELL